MSKLTNHEAYIQAMKDTIKRYAQAIAEGGPYNYFQRCSLCKVSGIYDNDVCCTPCPWMQIAGEKCSAGPRSDRSKYPARTVELQEWIKLYEEDLQRIKDEQRLKELEVKAEWVPEVGEMIEVRCEGSKNWEAHEFRGMVDGQYICTSSWAIDHDCYLQARPLRSSK
jgi:hypothetical protein